MEGEFGLKKEQAWDRAGTNIQCVIENISNVTEHESENS